MNLESDIEVLTIHLIDMGILKHVHSNLFPVKNIISKHILKLLNLLAFIDALVCIYFQFIIFIILGREAYAGHIP